MCTYRTEIVELSGSIKSNSTWDKLSSATIYFDHPFNAPFEHSLNIDFINSNNSFDKRVAIELNPQDARELAAKIQMLLDTEIRPQTSEDNRNATLANNI